MFGIGLMELLIAGVVLLLLVIAPFRFAFARAGFRYPLLLAIPTSIAVFFAAGFVGRYADINPLVILVAVAVAALVSGFEKSKPTGRGRTAQSRG